MTEEVNFEVEARKDGWVPKEDFRGHGEWVDAEAFVKRGQEINPILRANNERLKREIASERQKHDAELAEVKQSVEEFKVFQKEAYERKVRSYEQDLHELRAARSEATSQEDHEKAAQIEEKIDEVKEKVVEAKAELNKKPPEKKQEPVPEELSPEIKTWIASNPWYGDVENYLEETEMATSIGASIRKKFPSLTGQAFLDKLNERLDDRLPELRTPAKKGPSVEGATFTKRSSSGKKGYSSLPADAKEACDRFVKQKLMTQEQYLEDYEWGN